MFKAPSKKLKSVAEERAYLQKALADAVAAYRETNREIDDDVVRTLFRMLVLEYAEFSVPSLLAREFAASEHEEKTIEHELEIAHDTREALRHAAETSGVRNVATVLARRGKGVEYERMLKVLADLVFKDIDVAV